MAPLSNIAIKLLAQWRDMLERGLGYDSWGQVLEACKEYNSLAADIRSSLASGLGDFAESQAKFLIRTAGAAQLRTKAVQDLTGADANITFADMKAVTNSLTGFSDAATTPPFPIDSIDQYRHLVDLSYTPVQKNAKDITAAKPARNDQAAVYQEESGDEDEDDTAGDKQGTLQKKVIFPGKTNVSIRILKIQLKDPGSYIEPFFTVSVKDAAGNDLASPQDTPPTNERDDFIHFNQTVEIQVPLEDLPPDCAIFLEFKHYKPKRKKISTKCYSFIEMDELSNRQFPLEIYAKPTDFRRKKLNLLTEKPYYVHVGISLTMN